MICSAMVVGATDIPASGRAGTPVPFAEVGAKAGAQYHGDGLSVLATPQGARLRCVFQKLEGEVTTEGLWLTSTVDGAKGDRFRVIATSAGREAAPIWSPDLPGPLYWVYP